MTAPNLTNIVASNALTGDAIDSIAFPDVNATASNNVVTWTSADGLVSVLFVTYTLKNQPKLAAFSLDISSGGWELYGGDVRGATR
jgi:hypothetical protein